MIRPAKYGRRTGANLVVVGEIDITNRDDLVAAVSDALGRGATDVQFDMSGVTFIDCAGLGGLLEARALASEYGNTFRVVELSRPVRRLLELTDTSSILTTTSG